MPLVGAFSHNFALTAQPDFSDVAALVACEPTPVLVDPRLLSDLH